MLPQNRQSALDAEEPPEPLRPAAVASAGRQKRLSPRLQALREQLHILSLALRHPQTPWYAKALVFAVLAYAVSPMDLIPDFIPVLGLVDDLLIVPAGIWLSGKLVPAHILRLCRVRAALAEETVHHPGAGWGYLMVVGAWLLIVAALWLGFIAGR